MHIRIYLASTLFNSKSRAICYFTYGTEAVTDDTKTFLVCAVCLQGLICEICTFPLISGDTILFSGCELEEGSGICRNWSYLDYLSFHCDSFYSVN